jgi:hypothetical protein
VESAPVSGCAIREAPLTKRSATIWANFRIRFMDFLKKR